MSLEGTAQASSQESQPILNSDDLANPQGDSVPQEEVPYHREPLDPEAIDEGYDPYAVLTPEEIWWSQQYDWLLEAGYRLRTRYKPGWIPSWAGTHIPPQQCEDAQSVMNNSITHAIDLTTGLFVVLKKTNIYEHPREIRTMNRQAEEPRGSDPRNHAVRTLAVLEHPTEDSIRLLVLPLLRDFDSPPFETVGEILDFIWQLFEGVAFLHENTVAHGDISRNNILLDASEMYPEGFHPVKPDWDVAFTGPAKQKYTRTEKAPKYYMIDFGISQEFDEEEEHATTKRVGTDLTVPEYKTANIFNPFLVDIYCLGNMIKREFLDGIPEMTTQPGYEGFEFLRPLVEDMIQDDAESRPRMPQVLERFENLIKGLKSIHLRSRCRLKPMFADDKEPLPAAAILGVLHWYKQFSYVVRRLPAIPKQGRS